MLDVSNDFDMNFALDDKFRVRIATFSIEIARNQITHLFIIRILSLCKFLIHSLYKSMYDSLINLL